MNSENEKSKDTFTDDVKGDNPSNEEFPEPKVKGPGGELAHRPLHFIWIADCSGSMIGDKIGSLNFAIRESIPHMQKAADENPEAQVMVRSIKFSSGAQWQISDSTPVDKFKWKDLEAGGTTDMGKALKLVADQMKMPPMPERALPPVLVLISDGQPTDDYKKGLDELLGLPWGKKAVRMAVAIGKDADYDVLQKFIDNPKLKPLKSNNPEALVKNIKWLSTVVVKAASSPASQSENSTSSGVNIQIPETLDVDSDPGSANDVW